MEKNIIVITGKSGSGKSTFSTILANFLDAEIIDFDDISHLALDDKDIKKQLSTIFGNCIFDKSEKINRKVLGQIIFNDSKLLKKLNDICKKFMEEKIDKIIKTTDKKYVILDYALLPKMKYFKNANYKILIKAKKKIRHSRIIIRDNISIEYLNTREQSSINYKNAKFDIIIDNNSNFKENLQEFAENLTKKIQTPIN